MIAIWDNGETLEMSRHLGKYPEGIWMNFPRSWFRAWEIAERKVSEKVYICFLSQKVSILMAVSIDLILILQS